MDWLPCCRWPIIFPSDEIWSPRGLVKVNLRQLHLIGFILRILDRAARRSIVPVYDRSVTARSRSGPWSAALIEEWNPSGPSEETRVFSAYVLLSA